MVGGLGLLCSSGASAQSAVPQAGGRVATLVFGSIEGVVQDEKGAPVAGAMVSAVGASTSFVLSDRVGHFELRTLSPGSYLVRAHLTGFAAPRGATVEVRASSRASSSIALHHAPESYPILEAGMGVAIPASETATSGEAGTEETTGTQPADDHAETAWRLRHARRSVLKDATVPAAVLADDGELSDPGGFGQFNFFGTPARLATNFFADTPFSGQFNLLTTGSFDSPEQLFTTESFARSVADVSVGAPAAGHADWTVRAALTQGDVSSWIVAGSYLTRAPARHLYDVGLSYSTQRYNAGNPGAFHDVDGSRNAGIVYGFETFTISPAIAVTYGARYARYDYLDHRNLLSPRVALAMTPLEHWRINTLVSRRAVAPGAEEFVPPIDNSLWQPTQRTFSALTGGPLESERTTHAQLELQRDFGRSTVLVRGFLQQVDDQLVTVFGANMPGRPVASLGHYFVGKNGSVDASGWTTGVRTAFAERVRASVEYTQTRAHWAPTTDLSYLIVLAPSARQPESGRIHDVATTVETDVPETATKVLILYRIGNGFAHAPTAAASSDRSTFDSRFDVQVRQSLPFMDFSSARWEMLVAVRNFFRETAPDQSVYDELLVVRPPKRIVGGLTLHF